MLKNKCSVWKRIKFPTFWYNCYYFTWSDAYFIQLETLLINHPSYIIKSPDISLHELTGYKIDKQGSIHNRAAILILCTTCRPNPVSTILLSNGYHCVFPMRCNDGEMNAKRERSCVSYRLENAWIITSTLAVGYHDVVYSYSDKLILPPVRHIFASLSIQCMVLALLTSTLNCTLIEGIAFNHKCLFCKSNVQFTGHIHNIGDCSETSFVCASILSWWPFYQKIRHKKENYMEFSGPGSQNLNANSNNCLALFLGLFERVLSNVEKAAGMVCLHSSFMYRKSMGRPTMNGGKTQFFPPASAFTIRRNPIVSVHITEYSVLKGPHWWHGV